jgi:hypothetical protein
MSAYTILEFNKNTGQLLVKFAENMAPIAIDVPINENDLFITGEELETYIQNLIPTWHMERLNKLANGIANSNELASLVTPQEGTTQQLTSELTAEEKANLDMWRQIEEEKKIAKVLVKFGLLQEDPTSIPAATL